MPLKYDRREFVKIAALSGLSLSFPKFPFLPSIAPEPLFEKVADNIYIKREADGSVHAAIITDSLIEDQLTLNKLLNSADRRFTLIFYYKPDLESKLRGMTKAELNKLLVQREIIWPDSLPDIETGSVMVIPFKGMRFQLKKLELGTSPDASIHLTPTDNCQATVQYDPSDASIRVQAINGGQFMFGAHGQTALTTEIKIHLMPGPQTDTGHIRFRTSGYKDDPIRPFSPYLTGKTKTGSILPEILRVHYFDKNTFASNLDLQVTLWPFKYFDNQSEKGSYIQCTPKSAGLVKWNCPDQKGRRLGVADYSQFRARLVKLTREQHPFYFFVPDGMLTLKGGTDSRFMLLGYSGTERIRLDKAQLQVKFVRTNQLLIDFPGNQVKALTDPEEKQGLTAQLSFVQREYILDAEKAPLFVNTVKAGEQYSQSRYQPENTGSLENFFPLVPMYSIFKEEGELLREADKVFTVRRVGALEKGTQTVLQKSYITTQGFLRKGEELNYIDKTPNTKKNIKQPSYQNYRFRIYRPDMDFNLSILKEDVFFVLTPSMMRAGKTEFDIFFGIHGFDINLLQSEGQKFSDTENILIFKFSKYAIKELCQDPSKWSNHGLYAQGSLNTLAKAVSSKFQEFEKKRSPDYTYILDVVYKNPDWNGVLVLNVPLGSEDSLPDIFKGLTASQSLQKEGGGQKLLLETPLNIQYVALPVNKTSIRGCEVQIEASNLFALIDYDVLSSPKDSSLLYDYFNKTDEIKWKFVLTRLLIRFENGEIHKLDSDTFLKINSLFDSAVSGFDRELAEGKGSIKNLIKLNGSYQKNSKGQDEFNFSTESDVKVIFEDGNILHAIEISRIGFSYYDNHYRFDINASANLNSWLRHELFSIDSLVFENIGLKFDLPALGFPNIDIDFSRLLVFPKIDFNCSGFLRSFPIKFNQFRIFNIFKRNDGTRDVDFDFMKLDFELPDIGRLFSFIFDLDLGCLGVLDQLKGLNCQLLAGWSIKGGFVTGIRINGISVEGVNINLFGALGITIEHLQLCPSGNQYIVKLKDIQLQIFGLNLPPNAADLSGIIFARPHQNTAWFISYKSGTEPDDFWILTGQHIKTPVSHSVEDAFGQMQEVLATPIECKVLSNIADSGTNWLAGAQNFLPIPKEIVDLSFIFADPVLYGVRLGLLQLITTDIMYQKLGDDLGIWSINISLPADLRNIDAGALAITLPDIGIAIYTNGGWRLDVGFPNGNDWSRSGMAQLRPFVGWGGAYSMHSKTVSLTLFNGYLTGNDTRKLVIVQGGIALRLGIGAYISKGIFYAGASISVYGIMEGAFAFKKDGGFKQLFPSHFALYGRVGAIAELVGYVDFKIVKISIRIMLRVEIGLLLVYLGEVQNGHSGIQPVQLSIEGEVVVEVDFTIACFKVFGHRICIRIHLSFHAYVRFPFTIGGDAPAKLTNDTPFVPAEIVVDGITNIPCIFMPTVTKTMESGGGNYLVYTFAIPFFGLKAENNSLIQVSKENLIKDHIVKPVLEAILKAFRQTGMEYSKLRDVLLTSKSGDKKILFKYEKFRPNFIVGVRRPAAGGDTTEYFQFLSDHFYLTAGEAIIFYEHTAQDPCQPGTGRCPYRCMPMPISPNMRVTDIRDASRSWETTEGFSITIENLFKEEKTHTHTFRREEDYTASQVDEIARRFDKYKTQLIEGELPIRHLMDDKKDLREDVIIDEYFRLITLLALEIYAEFIFGQEKKGNEENNEHKPYSDFVVNPAEFLGSNAASWDFNEGQNIDRLIGQLNYFYSNGLRIMDYQSTTSTVAYYQALRQVKDFGSLIEEDGFADVKISLSARDKMTPLQQELFEDKIQFGEFLQKSRESLPADTGSIVNSFKSVKEPDPYQLLDVTAGIPNSDLGSETMRFFPIPDTIREQFSKGRKCFLPLHSAEETTVDHAICTNIFLKVKAVRRNDKTVALLLSNVHITDLSLMNDLHKYGLGSVRTASAYLRTDKQLTVLGRDGLNIIKTNVSPRTHPPVILDPRLHLMAQDNDRVNYADITGDLRNFVRLSWEALTTNNKGFYLINNRDINAFSIFADDKVEYDLLLSFELTAVGAPAPSFGFNNYYKAQNTNDLFAKLDKKEIYLFAKVFLDKQDAGGKYYPVKAYHSKIPAHCMSFEIIRQTTNGGDDFLQYAPIDMGLSERQADGSYRQLIHNDDFFPLMPQGKGNEKSYSHITPLIIDGAPGLRDRYSAVGKSYRLKFSLRDIYGFRFAELPLVFDHTHKYFDKLIPVNAWPFIQCSWWPANPQALSWEFKITVDTNEKNMQLLKNDDDAANIQRTLLTIAAQLVDGRCKLRLRHQPLPGEKILVTKLLDKDKVLEVVAAALKRTEGDTAAGVYTYREQFTFNDADISFKTPLQLLVEVCREGEDDLFHLLPSDEAYGLAWENGYIRQVSTPVSLTSAGKENVANALDELFMKETGYCIGVGASDMIFIIKRKLIAGLANDLHLTPQDNFYGIRPYSTQLWSGVYDREITMGGKQRLKAAFSQVDLDTGLQVVLQKIEQMLEPANLKMLTLEVADMLLECKKKLVKGNNYQLSDIARPDAELSFKLENVLEEKLLPSLDFEQLLLSRLSNFYQYNGVIAKTLLPSTELDGHRFTIDIAPQENYFFTSSKLHYNGQGPGWHIFVAPQDAIKGGSYAFKLIPKITHIEYDIEELDPLNGIQKSSWIQLVTPVNLAETYVSGFPVIQRVYPPTPRIILSKAVQNHADAAGLVWKSVLGAWTYSLGLANDDGYQNNDKLYIRLHMQSSRRSHLMTDEDRRQFENFIAYWSSMIVSGNINEPQFVAALTDELKRQPGDKHNERSAENGIGQIELVYQGEAQWRIVRNDGEVYLVAKQGDTTRLAGGVVNINQLYFGGANVLDTTHIVSIKPEIWLTRNEVLGGDGQLTLNEHFRYSTPHISPASWATVYVRYLNPISIGAGGLNSIFKSMPVEPNQQNTNSLPFKLTIKFLIDPLKKGPGKSIALPALPVKHIEVPARVAGSHEIDDEVKDHKAGYPAVSLTIYNVTGRGEENNLPVFHVDTVYGAYKGE